MSTPYLHTLVQCYLTVFALVTAVSVGYLIRLIWPRQ
jgi:hypothetical protein